MFAQSIIILVMTLGCRSLRRQFNHYQEFLEKQAQEKQALRSDYLKPLKYFEETNVGPERTLDYNPTYGYEAYWKNGDWVFTRKPKSEVKDPNSDCGSPCFELYKKYGPVCGQDRAGDHRDFPTICAMKSLDCTNRAGWFIIHRGPCGVEKYRTHPYIPNRDMIYTDRPVKALQTIIENFSKKYPGMGDELDWVK